MGAGLTSLMKDATDDSQTKIDGLKSSIDVQSKMLTQLLIGFEDKYEVFKSNLEKEGIIVTWPSVDSQMKVKVSKKHDDLKEAVGKVADFAGDAVNSIAGTQPDGGVAKQTTDNLKNMISSAMNVMLGGVDGEEEKRYSASYMVDVDNLKITLLYYQSYNINMSSSALDGERHVASFCYLMNGGIVDPFSSDHKTILTKLGTGEIDAYYQMLTKQLENERKLKELTENIKTPAVAPTTVPAAPTTVPAAPTTVPAAPQGADMAPMALVVETVDAPIVKPDIAYMKRINKMKDTLAYMDSDEFKKECSAKKLRAA